MWGAAIVAFAGAFLLLFASGPATTSASTTARASWRATEAVLPANAVTGENRDVNIESVSCASAGNCSAVGNYIAVSDVCGHCDEEGLLLTEKAGRWRAGVEATVPAKAGARQVGVWLSSVSCASAGNCTAVGFYTDVYADGTGGDDEGLLLTEKAGKWAPGVAAALPANSASRPGVVLNSVSCASAGNCTAVGSYANTSGGSAGLLLTETAGRWRTGVAPLPRDAAAPARVVLSSVSCASAGNCSAVGYYNGGFKGGEGLLLTKKAGRWLRGVEAAMPKNAREDKPVSLTSVSCASAGNCSAVGTYNNNVSSRDLTIHKGVLLTEKAGKWQAGVKAALPANSAGGEADLNSVSCASAGNCVAVGDYGTGRGVAGLLVTQKAGKWRRGIQAAEPRNAGAGEDVQLSSVSCASARNCTAVDGAGGLVVTETAGRWASGVEAALPSNLHFPAGVVTVSCPSAGSCSAAGQYVPSGREGLLLDSSVKPCVVPKLKGKTLPAARRSIKSHDCSVGKIQRARSRTVAKRHVISQRPRPGRRLNHGAKVNLEVSKGR
jgi:hypothetical protein